MGNTKYKFLKELAVAFFGVSAALLLNSQYDRHLKKDSYLAMGKAIIAEAKGNSIILKNSFMSQIKDTSYNSKDSLVIYREFKTKVAEDCLGNDNFMNFLVDSNIQFVSDYILTLRRMNAFRQAYQKYIEEPKENMSLRSHVRKAIFIECDSASKAIQKIELLSF